MCGNTSAGHFHIFLECPALSLFWGNVIKEIRSILGSDIDCFFSLMYLGNLPTSMKKQDRYLIKILLASCKKAITRKWLSKEPPTISEWKEIIGEIYIMERLTFSL